MPEETETEMLTCPFCEDGDFDPLGLKIHLERGHCEIYNVIDTSRCLTITD